jgi:ACS family tartrate transporter-like MFS transporter
MAAALALSQHVGENVPAAIVLFSSAMMGLFSGLASFWALPTVFLTEAGAAASIGLINAVGNLGGFAGPYVVGFLSSQTGNFGASLLFLVGTVLLSGVLVLGISRHPQA